MKLLLLSTVGEWLEANLLGLVVALVGWLSSAAVLIWKLSQVVASIKETDNKVESLAEAFAKQGDDLYGHTADSTVHTTFEQRQAINARFDKIERTMENGYNRIENKIDRWAEKMLNK